MAVASIVCGEKFPIRSQGFGKPQESHRYSLHDQLAAGSAQRVGGVLGTEPRPPRFDKVGSQHLLAIDERGNNPPAGRRAHRIDEHDVAIEDVSARHRVPTHFQGKAIPVWWNLDVVQILSHTLPLGLGGAAVFGWIKIGVHANTILPRHGSLSTGPGLFFRKKLVGPYLSYQLCESLSVNAIGADFDNTRPGDRVVFVEAGPHWFGDRVQNAERLVPGQTYTVKALRVASSNTAVTLQETGDLDYELGWFSHVTPRNAA